MKLNADELYFSDNGRILHGKCSGTTAQITGRDLSGISVLKVSKEDRSDWIDEIGDEMVCEQCKTA